jgi:hypothetical protein
VGVLEKDTAQIGEAEASAEVAKLVTVARRHLDELENLNNSHAKAGAH